MRRTTQIGSWVSPGIDPLSHVLSIPVVTLWITRIVGAIAVALPSGKRDTHVSWSWSHSAIVIVSWISYESLASLILDCFVRW